ncbi:MAG TPA: peroxiredoxin family protein [Micropepsaceae bacterium]|jgi:peroxiredoxin|nr:peroxiredoxin family protein [Micropepsaceae bacterium]
MRRFVWLTIALIFAFGLLAQGVLPASANPDFDLGPPVNTKVPDIGTPPDQTGTPRSLNSLMGEKGLVLFFFRSADWCPFCQAQMMDLNTGVAAMEKRGYHLAGISYDSPDILKTFIERRKLTYTLLSDPKSEVIDRYKLRDPQYPPGNRAYGVPRPIIFILDRNGVIKAKLYEDTYTKRPPATLVVETLDKVAAAK